MVGIALAGQMHGLVALDDTHVVAFYTLTGTDGTGAARLEEGAEAEGSPFYALFALKVSFNPAGGTRLKSDETDSRASVNRGRSGAPSRDPLRQPFASSSIWNVRLMCPCFLDLRGAIRVANECLHRSYPSGATLCTSPPATAAPPIQLPSTATASATTMTLSC